VIILDTDHPGWQPDLVKAATGQIISLPEKLSMMKNLSEPIAEIEPQLEALEGAIASCF
jgi:threonine synthase